MKTAALALTLVIIAVAGTSAHADDRHDRGGNRFATELSGYNEVHFIFSTATTPPTAALRGAVSTAASGSFKARIDDDAQTIQYELSYADLEGSVTQAHIHFGQKHTVGGIVVWLCETDAAQHPVPALRRPVTPQCPQSGTVTGTIGPDKVIDVPGDAARCRGIAAGVTSGRRHSGLRDPPSSSVPPGEIRGHIGHGEHE